jgi:hypothetical protein
MDSVEFAILIGIEFGLHEQVVLHPILFECFDDLGKTIGEDWLGLLIGTGILRKSDRSHRQG